jgi:hypothetical protein
MRAAIAAVCYVEAQQLRLREYGVDPAPYLERARAVSQRSMLSFRDALGIEVDRAARGEEPSTDVMDKKKA